MFFMYWELAWTFVQYSRGMSLSLCRFSELLMKMQRDEICAWIAEEKRVREKQLFKIQNNLPVV